MRASREPWIFALTAASAAAVLISIAAAQILLVAACVLCVISRTKLCWPRYCLPLGAMICATLLSMAASPDPALGIWSLRKFWLFAIGLLAANFVTSVWRAGVAFRMILGAAAAASILGLVQFGLAEAHFLATGQLADDPAVLARIKGPMGHWMTFGGEQLLVWCAAIPALIVIGRRWIVPVALVGAAIVLSFTRGVWIGAVAGLTAVTPTLPGRLWLGVALSFVVVGIGASPLVYRRLMMSFEKDFAPDTSRLAMLRVGASMIRDHPLVGVGP